MNRDELLKRIEQAARDKATSLCLEECDIKELPAEIGQLKQLTMLDLGGNQLTELPAEISQLTQLTTLQIDNNKLTSLPSWIGQLSKLDGSAVARQLLAGWRSNARSVFKWCR
ncbi:MAG: hypothetical protein O3A00_24495 [Planctomycetota bacterium]|nr:hypothetical protein [Planctomycetota bacterium]